MQDDEADAAASCALRGHCGAITAIAMTPAGQLISADVHGSVIVWRSGKGRAGQSAAGVQGVDMQLGHSQHSNTPALASSGHRMAISNVVLQGSAASQHSAACL